MGLNYLRSAFMVFVIGASGCKKFVQINPPSTQIAAITVFSNNTSAAAAMAGIYANMMSNPNGNLASGYYSINLLQGLAADELTNYYPSDPILPQFYTNALSSASGTASNDYYWTELYQEIYAANAVIEGLRNSSSVTAAVRQQLTGEATFLRAFLHFYAVNLYGPVPIVTTTNYQLNNTIKRSSVSEVYQQIIRDLEAAQTDLSGNFVNGTGVVTTERTRPNEGAATALLARAFLYTNQWDSAEIEAGSLISNSTQYGLSTDLNTVFLANSMEAIWQLQPVAPGYNTSDAYYFVLTSPPGSSQFPVSISSNLLTVFEPGDKRDSNWVGIYTADSINYYYFPNKYKIGTYNTSNPVTEYEMVFRLAEQFLIRAEARVQQGNILGAQTDLNMIRARAGLAGTTANNQASLLTAILHERQTELFTEWGHRWFDLIRTANINAILGSPGNVFQSKGGSGSWNPDWALLPLPLSETQINPNLTQNPGYN
jgi:hypothetical protein